MFRDRNLTRKWKRIFRLLYGVLIISSLALLFVNIENVFINYSLYIVLGVDVLLLFILAWFAYNLPEKLEMEKRANADM